MTVAQAEHPAVVQIVFTTLDFHESEVAHAVVREAVRLGADDEAVAADGAFHILHQFDVRDGSPAFGGMRCGHLNDLMAFSGTSAAVEDEVGMGTLDERGGFEFEMSDHSVSFFRCLRVKTSRAGASGGCARPVPCEYGLMLDADSLQAAQGLTHGLDFLLAGLLLAHGLADVIPEPGQAVDGFTESGLDRLDLHEGGFQ